MTDSPPSQARAARRRTIGLIVLALAAFGVRVAAVMVLHAEHARPLAYEHGAIAENLLAGRGFSVEFLGQTGPTSQQAPLYPLLVAAAYACFGPGTSAALVAIQLLQCSAGSLLVVCVVWLGWQLVPEERAIGWFSGVGAALYPPHVYMVTHVQVAVWAALLLTVVLVLATRRSASDGWRRPITCGALAGLMLLVEPILVLAVPVLTVAFALATYDAPRPALARDESRPSGSIVRRWSRALAIPVMACVVILPWSARNYLVHGEGVFIKSTFGYAFWQGNNASSWGTDKVPKASADAIRDAHDGSLADANRALWEARHETLYIDDVLLKPSGYAEFTGLSEPARSRLLLSRAIDFIRAHPQRYAALCVHRLRYMLLFDATNPKAAHPLYRASSIAWLVLSLVGLLAARAHLRRLWPTLAIFALVIAFHALVIASARFRIPLEPMTLVWAAAAVAPPMVRLLGGRSASPAKTIPLRRSIEGTPAPATERRRSA